MKMIQKTKYFFQLALIALFLIIYIYDARALRSDIEKFETAISDIDLQLEAGAEVVNDMNKIRQDFIKNKKILRSYQISGSALMKEIKELAYPINDIKGNCTRFVLLQNRQIVQEGKMASIAFSLKSISFWLNIF